MKTRSDKMIKVPRELPNNAARKVSIKLDGLSVIEFSYHTESRKRSYFLKDHLLLIVRSGVYTLRFGDRTYTVWSNELMFIHKSIAIEFEKKGDPYYNYAIDYMMVFLNDKIVDEFLKFAGIKTIYPVDDVIPVTVLPVNDRIRSYIESLKPYIEKPDEINEGLVRIKLMELLFHVADSHERFLYQLMQPMNKERGSIVKVMEENIANPVSLNDLAFLSGRSLATFKRDFQAKYHTSPLKWIRNRRLDKAKELLAETNLTVTDVCFSSGFENIAHFSKVFKEKFGLPPSKYRQQRQKQ
ncbi:AraC family transcriptional regulator [Paenibacillus dokdonensis]|uniref:AraC family transcriptional regulator n=1 Tax=Paenibacillus dokdonensis TaxID=2567944 RepID=UPI0010A7AFA2|nr:AraC family transcriptional regulator [Paenibacillus dokdonensis]